MFSLLFVLAAAVVSPPAGPLTVDASHPDVHLEHDFLRLGGTNPAGSAIGVNNRYLTLDGHPWVPVMGEFHFSRYPRAEWEEELLKMKAGGVTVVATYLFWIYHEETEGHFDWSGDRDIRAFVQLCAKHGLYVYPRIGPWAHGEVRQGGFPDWLLQRCGSQVRRDAEPYLGYVRRYYAEIGRQLQGLLWKDGGPIIGIQLDNELRNNPTHLLTLKRIALASGLQAPLFTVTGWDRARLPLNGEVLPLFGGYPDGFWIDGLKWDSAGRRQYFFGLDPDDSAVGDDLQRKPQYPPEPELARFPYGACEIGGGIAVSYRRRPALNADDVAAEALTKLGSGSNWQGYYMYHGGANAIGAHSTLNETRASGSPNDLPEINYDFQAPLRQYGQRSQTYAALRIQNSFLADFGPQLAPLAPVMPAVRPSTIEDHATLRWSVRSDGRHGFIFVNNYQHLDALPLHEGVQFAVKLADHTLRIPAVPTAIPSGTYFIWPFHQTIGGADLIYATAQPLCRIGGCWVFFATGNVAPEFVFDPATLAPDQPATVSNVRPGTDCLIPVNARDGSHASILVLTSSQARQAWKARLWGQDRLFLSTAAIVFDSDQLRLQSFYATMDFAVWPAVPVAGATAAAADGIFTRYTVATAEKSLPLSWHPVRPAAAVGPVRVDAKGAAYAPTQAEIDASAGIWQATLPAETPPGVHASYLTISYAGDLAQAYFGDQLVDDDYYFARPWQIVLERFSAAQRRRGLTVKIFPLRQDAPIYLPPDRFPDFQGDAQIAAIRNLQLHPEYEITVQRAAPAATAPVLPTSVVTAPPAPPR